MPDSRESLGWMRLAGAGIELAGSFLVLAGLGYLVDGYFGWSGPWGFITGGILGFVIGLTRLMRLAIQYNRD